MLSHTKRHILKKKESKKKKKMKKKDRETESRKKKEKKRNSFDGCVKKKNPLTVLFLKKERLLTGWSHKERERLVVLFPKKRNTFDSELLEKAVVTVVLCHLILFHFTTIFSCPLHCQRHRLDGGQVLFTIVTSLGWSRVDISIPGKEGSWRLSEVITVSEGTVKRQIDG